MKAPAVVAMFLLGLIAGSGSLSAQDAVDEDPATLVRELGNESFQAREAATARLARMGLTAKDALLAGLADPDAEIRLRCRRVLETVLDLDFRDRIRRFAEDREGREQHDIPGWDEFRKLVGDTPAVRGLYVEVLEAEPHLMEVLGTAPANVPEMVVNRSQQLQMKRTISAQNRQPQDISLGSIVAMLFVTCHPDVTLPEPVQNTTLSYLNFPAFQTAIASGQRVDVLKSLLAGWILRGKSQPLQTMGLALRYQIPAGIVPAIEVIEKKQDQAQVRMQAMLVVGRFGSKKNIPLLESQLTDTEAVPYRVKNMPPTEARDVALAVLVKLTGQKPADYGYTRAQENPQYLFNLQSLGFADEAARQAALDKWKTWRTEHAAELEEALKTPSAVPPAQG